jgi:16S rRNA (uracil1498-N3)-methyltransferase
MSRFYVGPQSVKDGLIKITGPEAHHIADVMRLKSGDEVVTFDGSGSEYRGLIQQANSRSVTIRISSSRKVVQDTGTAVTLIQAIPKKDKMDYIVEKASELGVSAILPVMCERSIPDWDRAKKIARVERWRKIAICASKQCARTDVPKIEEITTLDEAASRVSGCALKLIATLGDKTVTMKEAMSSSPKGPVAIAIGPEGDFTAGEVASAMGHGFVPVSLGQRVLKSDTAGLAAIVMINYGTKDR